MRFYALQTKANCERAVCRNLERIGFCDVVAPLVKKTMPTRRNPHKMMTVLQPFFRSYVFVRLAPMAIGWHKAERVRGAGRFVRFGDQSGPSPLPCGFVETLQSIMDSDGAVCLADAAVAAKPSIRDLIRAGKMMRLALIDGPFAGHSATSAPLETARDIINALARLDTRQRLCILTSMFGQSVSVEVDLEQVMLVSDITATPMYEGQRRRRLA